MVLWSVQIVVAVVFFASAVTKGTWDRDRLVRSGQTGVADLPISRIRLIAFAELCGGLGLILPQASGVATVLTPLAAVGLGIIMMLAARVHIRLGEPTNVAINLCLLGACVYIVVGRL